MSNDTGKINLIQTKTRRRRRLVKRSITNLVLMEYDGMENIRKMLSTMGYTLKSKQVEENELAQLSSVLCENVALLEETISLKAKNDMFNHSLRYKDVLLNSYRNENRGLKRRIAYLQRGMDNVMSNANNCDVNITDENIQLKVNNTIDITLEKKYSNHELADCIICFDNKPSVKLPCSHFICCDCVIYAKDSKLGESMLLDRCPYCRKATTPNLIRININ